MPRAVAGVLVECDQSIKAILVKIDSESGNKYISEDIDDQHVLIKRDMYDELKQRLDEELADTVREPDDSDSDSDNNKDL